MISYRSLLNSTTVLFDKSSDTQITENSYIVFKPFFSLKIKLDDAAGAIMPPNSAVTDSWLNSLIYYIEYQLIYIIRIL